MLVGNRFYPAATTSDFALAVVGVTMSVAGYMLAHKALEGVWL